MIIRFIALLIFIFLIPLFIIIALCILIEDGPPIFFKQKRNGSSNRLFYIYKFRTMKNDTPNVATHLLKQPEIYLLKTGKFLRKTSLDELPNLINIIKGEMVFVGPRPALFNQFDLIEKRKNVGVDRLKPGITGWAQINGRDDLDISEKVELELEYLTKKSFYFDFKIIILTIKSVLSLENIKH